MMICPRPCLSLPSYEVQRKAVLVRRLEWPRECDAGLYFQEFLLLDRRSVAAIRSKVGRRLLVLPRVFQCYGQFPEGCRSHWMQITERINPFLLDSHSKALSFRKARTLSRRGCPDPQGAGDPVKGAEGPQACPLTGHSPAVCPCANGAAGTYLIILAHVTPVSDPSARWQRYSTISD